jgi:lipoprotein YgeR
LSATTNEPVACVKEGTVIYNGVYRGFGKVLFIQSKTGLIYAYTNLSSVSVKKGDYIVFGKEIGKVGIDSITGKPQLMFMVFQNGQPIDPSVAPRG